MSLPHNKKIQTNPESDLPWNQPDDNGFYHIDDMLLNEFQFKQQFGSTEEETAQTRNAIANEMLKWPNGELKFFFMDSVTDTQKQQVRSAYAKFNSIFEGCLKINEIAPTNLEDTNVVFLTNYDRSGCFSAIGRQGYYQQLNLGHSIVLTIIQSFTNSYTLLVCTMFKADLIETNTLISYGTTSMSRFTSITKDKITL